MNCLTFGRWTSLTNSLTTYNFLNPGAHGASTTERNASNIISEDITITGVNIYLTTAPTGVASWTFTIRDDAAGTSAVVAITGAATSGSWSGSVAISAGSFVSIECVPSGTPTTATADIQISYTTTGQKCLLMGGATSNSVNSATRYQIPHNGTNDAYGTNVLAFYMVIPTGGTFTKMTVGASGAPGAGTSYAVSARLNDTTDFLTTTLSDAETSDSVTGTQAVSAGDTLVTKFVPASSPAVVRMQWCLTFEPTTNGECIFGSGSVADPGTGTIYGRPMAHPDWDSTESITQVKPPAGDYKKFYVRIGTAPSAGDSRTYTFRDNGGDTSLAVTIADAATTGNDTTHTHTMSGGGNTGHIKQTTAGTPASITNGVHWGYVIAVAQGGGTTIKDIISTGLLFPR